MWKLKDYIKVTPGFLSAITQFLDAATHLYRRSCPSVGPSVSWSVAFFFFDQNDKKMTKNDQETFDNA